MQNNTNTYVVGDNDSFAVLWLHAVKSLFPHPGASSSLRRGLLAAWLQSSRSHGARVYNFLFPSQPRTSEKLWPRLRGLSDDRRLIVWFIFFIVRLGFIVAFLFPHVVTLHHSVGFTMELNVSCIVLCCTLAFVRFILHSKGRGRSAAC